jgi:ubiquinone/menaquinone biosynthesis C-methylase UbiE
MSQEFEFLNGEGDKWFQRNKQTLENRTFDYPTSIIKRTLQNHTDNINSILEIGCSNGTKINDLANHFNARGFGVDPSQSAILEGQTKYKHLELSQGTASKLPFSNDFFDLVFFGFCLYLLDRKDIFLQSQKLIAY